MTLRRIASLAALLLSACVTTSSAQGPTLSPREQAQVALQKGDGALAVKLLTPLFEKSPTDLTLARLLAEAHVKAGDAEAFLKSLSTRDDAVAWYQRGLVLYSRASDATGPAVEAFQKAVALEPQEPELHYRLGLALLESERYEASLPELARAVEKAPDRAGWSLPLAKALFHTGDTKGAVNAIRVAVLGGPTPSEVKLARGLMEQISDPFAGVPASQRPKIEQAMQWLEGADVPQQAIVNLEEIEHDYPDLAVVHSLLGLAWARIDDAGKAVEEFKRAIELAPEDGKTHLYLGELYLGRQKAKQAEEQYQAALERNPVLTEAWFRLGDFALERQDLVSARRHFTIASRLSPESTPAHGKLALVHQLEGDWPAADRELHAVLDREPENLEFVLRLGLLHAEHAFKAKSAKERSEARAEASKWLDKVLEAQPENALASRALEKLNSPVTTAPGPQ